MNSPYVLSRVVNVDDEILRNNMQENNLAKSHMEWIVPRIVLLQDFR